MKKSLLLITMLLLSAAWVFAQMPSTSQSSATSGQTSASSQSGQASATASTSAETSIRGCLGGSAGSYTLTDSASGKTYNLSGSSDKLSAHVGQEVELKGASEAASAGMAGGSASNPPASSASSGAGQAAAGGENFNVKSVSKIADTCTNK